MAVPQNRPPYQNHLADARPLGLRAFGIARGGTSKCEGTLANHIYRRSIESKGTDAPPVWKRVKPSGIPGPECLSKGFHSDSQTEEEDSKRNRREENRLHHCLTARPCRVREVYNPPHGRNSAPKDLKPHGRIPCCMRVPCVVQISPDECIRQREDVADWDAGTGQG